MRSSDNQSGSACSHTFVLMKEVRHEFGLRFTAFGLRARCDEWAVGDVSFFLRIDLYA